MIAIRGFPKRREVICRILDEVLETENAPKLEHDQGEGTLPFDSSSEANLVLVFDMAEDGISVSARNGVLEISCPGSG